MTTDEGAQRTMKRLRWRQVGRTSHSAAAPGGGRYTVDRWEGTWSMHFVARGWPQIGSTPPRRIEWRDGVRHTLVMAKNSCQIDCDEVHS